MKITEKILTVIAILATIMKLLHWPGANILLILSLLFLSILYMYFGFAFFNNIRLREIFKKDSYKETAVLRIIGAIFTGIIIGSGLIGILFVALFWPGGLIMLSFIIFFGLILLSFIVYKLIRTGAIFYKRILFRLGVVYLLSLFLYLLPWRAKLNWRYPSDPDYVEAYIEYHENPTDPISKFNYELERSKMEEKYPHNFK